MLATDSNLASTLPEKAKTKRPRPVVLLIQLLWTHITLGAFAAVWSIWTAGHATDVSMFLFAVIFSMPIAVVLTMLISRGHGWARHTWSALYVFHLLFIKTTVEQLLTSGWVSCALGIAAEVAIAVALTLSYLPTARGWFHHMRSARRFHL